MSSNRLISVALIVSLSLSTLAGCASNSGSNDYSQGQARTVQEVSMGTVTEVRPVTINGSQSPMVGTVGGAVVGGLAGSEVGGGKGSIVGSVLGAVLGGMGGSAIEQKVTSQNGVRITVQLDSGRMIAVTQGTDQIFNVGDRVQVLSGNGVTRVTH